MSDSKGHGDDQHGHGGHGGGDHHDFDPSPARELGADEPRTPAWLTYLGAGLFLLGSVYFFAGGSDAATEPGGRKPGAGSAAQAPQNREDRAKLLEKLKADREKGMPAMSAALGSAALGSASANAGAAARAPAGAASAPAKPASESTAAPKAKPAAPAPKAKPAAPGGNP